MNRAIIVFPSLLFIAACGSQNPNKDTVPAVAETEAENDDGKLWVGSEYLDRHSCPKDSCGVVGRLMFREAATPLEERDGWVRITKEYDGACEGGVSRYVDKGNKACSSANGFRNGKFSEWVRKEYLSATRPADPADTATADESLVAQSDDFARYRKQFANIAAKLVADGRCTKADFEEQGGFVKSVNEYRNEPVYFIYCGGFTAANKLYVNAETGEIIGP